MARRRRRRYPSNWKRLRLQILDQDAYVCQIQGPGCHRSATDVDHIIPLVQGGSSDPSNLRAACAPCNRSAPDGRTRGPNLLID